MRLLTILNVGNGMGQLKPGATYIYERVGNTTYAREMGSEPSTRFPIGHDWDPVSGHKLPPDARLVDGKTVHEQIKEDQMWGEIRRMARTNVTLQSELERVIIVYNLIKEEQERENNSVAYHRV